MTKDGVVEHYADGERQCPICREPLRAHSTWPGTRYRFCGKPDCATAVKYLRKGLYIAADEEKCQNPECSNFVPGGRWDKGCKFIACSPECFYKRGECGSILMTCHWCKKQFFRRPSRRPNKSGHVFCSTRHSGNFVIDKVLSESCGIFRPIADEYLNGVAQLNYRDVRCARKALATLFLFLTEQGTTSLEDVSPQTITKYILWMNSTGRKLASDTLSCISTFFNWMISEDQRERANPVTRWHRSPRKKLMPRPLNSEERKLLWRILDERGNARVRLAAALGEEAGLRNSEICRLQIPDVDLQAQRLRVRLPNKTMTERDAFFGEKTIRYWHEWMRDRDASCGHDVVLYNDVGTPFKHDTLAEAFKRVVLKKYHGVERHSDGFDKWSIHRLRHTMASALVEGGADLATVMAAGGWIDPDTMTGYAEVPAGRSRRGYDEAMRSFHEQKELAPETRTVTADELLELLAAEEDNEGVFEESADCV